jgi:DNA-binding response OmpR family regulator
MRVLLIEPDRVLSQTLKEGLESFGHAVLIKGSAQTGLDGVDHHKPEVIVLEIQLSKHNGVEFLYELRSHADWLKVPIIIHTSNIEVLGREYAVGWQELGVMKVLYKSDTTLAKLNKHIEAI